MLFLLPILLFLFAENILQYSFPIITERVVANNTQVGLILGLSSVIGIACDFLFSKFLKRKSWKFHAYSAATLALFIPTFLIMGNNLKSVLLLLVVTSVWGVYYELYSFFVQSYITTEEKKNMFSRDWGLVFLVFGFMSILAPVVASVLVDLSVFGLCTLMFVAYVLAYLTSLILSVSLESKHKKKENINTLVDEMEVLSLSKELKVWEVLGIKLSPIVIMTTVVQFVVAAFWTYGGLFGESLFTGKYLDFIPLVLFNIPFLIGSVAVSKLNIQKGKKHISLVCMFMGGAFLVPLLFVTNIFVTGAILFLCGLFLSISSALNEAVYSDLISRAGKYGSDILGLDKSNNSLAFVLAPFICGYMSDIMSFSKMFGVVGIATAIFATILLIFIPSKLKIPKSQLGRLS